MTYQELIRKLYTAARHAGCRPGLDTMSHLMEALHHPERAFQAIHVAGTNGKGSTTTKIAVALELAGHRVGCYTSPHLSCFRERIQINRQLITEQQVTRHLTEIMRLAAEHGISATFFELTTALAFAYFAHEGVSVAVIEVGLGGRLDATNILPPPLLGVITSIGFDHMDILGGSLEEIAREKAGIIKEGVPVVLGPTAQLPPILEIARFKNSPVFVEEARSLNYDQENSAIAKRALQTLAPSLHIPEWAIAEGLKHRPPCRMEGVQGKCSILLDVAHNPDGMRRLVESLSLEGPYHFLCGFSQGKDVIGCLKILAPLASSFGFVSGYHERSFGLSQLLECARLAGIPEEKVRYFPTVREALEEKQQEVAAVGGVLVVCGSCLMMGQVRASLGFVEPQDSLNLNEVLRVKEL